MAQTTGKAMPTASRYSSICCTTPSADAGCHTRLGATDTSKAAAPARLAVAFRSPVYQNFTHWLWSPRGVGRTIRVMDADVRDDPRIPFGLRVRELRRARALSQEELAARAGLHTTYLSGIERGRRNVSLINIHRLADALAVHPGELFQRSAAPEAEQP